MSPGAKRRIIIPWLFTTYMSRSQKNYLLYQTLIWCNVIITHCSVFPNSANSSRYVWYQVNSKMIFVHDCMHLRNEQRVDQVLALDFCVSALPASCSGMIVTTVQCPEARRSRHFGMWKCASFYEFSGWSEDKVTSSNNHQLPYLSVTSTFSWILFISSLFYINNLVKANFYSVLGAIHNKIDHLLVRVCWGHCNLCYMTSLTAVLPEIAGAQQFLSTIHDFFSTFFLSVILDGLFALRFAVRYWRNFRRIQAG